MCEQQNHYLLEFHPYLGIVLAKMSILFAKMFSCNHLWPYYGELLSNDMCGWFIRAEIEKMIEIDKKDRVNETNN
jgi:hypothetical protein